VAKKIRIDAREVSKEIRRGGSGTHVPEGEYLVKLNDAEVKTTKDESGRYIRWECIIVEPVKYKGKRLFGNTSLKKEALWSLRNLIHAAVGKNIAGRTVDFDPDTVIGKTVGASVSDNVYDDSKGNERITSQIDSFFPKGELNVADDDEEEDEDEETDEEDEEDEEEDDEEEDEEEEPPPRRRKKKKPAEDDDDDLEDVDVEDI